MDIEEIEFLESIEKFLKVQSKTKFEFRPDKKYHFLQKLALKLLSCIGCFAIEDETKVTRHRINKKDFLDNLTSQRKNLLNFYDINGSVLLVGNDEYMEITNNPAVFKTIRFTCEYKKQNEILGMKVMIVPWMKGVLVLP